VEQPKQLFFYGNIIIEVITLKLLLHELPIGYRKLPFLVFRIAKRYRSSSLPQMHED